MSNDYIRYRIGIINDFQDSYHYVDYQEFKPDIWILNACRVKGESSKYTVVKDSIGVFLNYQLIGEFKDTALASDCIIKLMEAAPISLDYYKEFLLPP